LTAEINRIDPGRTRDVLVYRGHLPSVSFYRGKIAAMAFGMPREVQFERDEAWKDTYIADRESLLRFLAARNELFVVAAPDGMAALISERPMSCTKVAGTKRFDAYLCGT
jgi:4-amino-4-deoxy-L-arabinose transferase